MIPGSGGNRCHVSPGTLQIVPALFNCPSYSLLLNQWCWLETKSERKNVGVSCRVSVQAASSKQDHTEGRKELQLKRNLDYFDHYIVLN